jgi:hypothetical protein
MKGLIFTGAEHCHLSSNLHQTTRGIKIDDARGTAFDLLEKQIFEDARQEAIRPTNIPDGELREVRRYDETGRPFYEFHGKPSSWMSQFMNGTRKRLVGIFSPGAHNETFTG